jgi:hypothetical protein
MKKLKTTTIEKLDSINDLSLVTDSKEVSYFFEYLAIKKYKAIDYSMFVKQADGEIIEAYIFLGTVPYLHKEAIQVR